ncbi:MAG TPA: sulfatase-like hydrolase/transferase, partial [Planctomycetota bacterium]|nr:sulfatase-like hydrolase/transferase [Planctomycetota bacterium]
MRRFRFPATRRALLFFALLGGACSRSRPESLLLVTFDTTRADRLGAYGGARDVSPNFDSLAAHGALLETAFSAVPLTLPSHATILTGLEPPEHGIRMNGTRLPPGVPTIAESLRGAGFSTAAVVASGVLDLRFGLQRGFELYDGRFTEGTAERRAAVVSELAVGWLRSLPAGQRFFLWVHFIDPHHPYDPPPPFDERFRGRAYEGEIASADDGLGRILAALREEGRIEKTLVCVTADHGESLGEHGEPWHGVFLYDATVRVPLVISHPPTVSPRRVRGPARLVDLAPTLLDLLGVPGPPGMSGRSFASSLASGEVESASPVHLESDYTTTLGCAPLRGLRTAQWKYVRAPRPELYRVDADASELRDLAAAEPEAAARFDRSLGEIERRLETRKRSAQVDLEASASLAGFGYLGAATAPGSSPARDAKDAILVLGAVDRAISLEAAGREEEAATRFEEAVGADPLGAEAAFSIAQHCRSMKKPASARAWAERATSRDPRHAPALVLLAELASASRDLAAAEARLREAVRVSPGFVPAEVGLVTLLLSTGRDGEAEALLRAATTREPSAFEAWKTLGLLLAADPARRREAIT